MKCEERQLGKPLKMTTFEKMIETLEIKAYTVLF